MKPSIMKIAMATLAIPTPPHRRAAQYSYRRFVSPRFELDQGVLIRPEPEEGAVLIDSTGTFDFVDGAWKRRVREAC